MTKEEAERLSVVFLQIAGRLNETAAFVRDKDDEAGWREYRRAVGKTIAEVEIPAFRGQGLASELAMGGKRHVFEEGSKQDPTGLPVHRVAPE
ncbi:hypothetical protein [Dyella sp. 2RAB6]|uniref:hypothetical protein n=1 Tax=Dyella sp. 2RAB6 TaxID=3232992 RepID=UPI003F8EF1EA